MSQDGHPIWDEYEWESHINEMARRHQQLRHIMEPDAGNRPRWFHHLREAPTKLDAVDAYIEEELMIEETHFPFFDNLDDEDFSDVDDELYDPAEEDDFYNNLENLEELFRNDDEDNELTEDQSGDRSDDLSGDVSDELSDSFSDDTDFDEDLGEEYITEGAADYASLENIAIYTEARDLAADLLLFNDTHPEYLRHKGFIHLVSETLYISSRLAAAYSMGFEPEVTGANIAYCKQALQKANETLAHLQTLKQNPIERTQYFDLHKRLFELRNHIGMHVQEVRHYFLSML